MTGKNRKKTVTGSSSFSGGTECRKRRRFHLMTLIFYFLLVVVLTVLAGVGIWAKIVYGPMDIASADRKALKNWILLRRFDKESPETRRELLLKYVELYGPNAPIKSDHKKSIGFIKDLSRKYVLERQKKTLDWEKERYPLDLLRSEYSVKPSLPGVVATTSKVSAPNTATSSTGAAKGQGQTGGQAQVFILPENIQASDHLKDLEQKVKAIPAATRMEQNLRYLVRDWFFWKMEEYARQADAEKLPFLLKTVDQIDYWQEFYVQSLIDLDLPRLGTLELYRDFMLTIYWWYEASENTQDLARLLWFKDALVSIMVARQIGMEPQAPVFKTPEILQQRNIVRKISDWFKKK